MRKVTTNCAHQCQQENKHTTQVAVIDEKNKREARAGENDSIRIK